MDFLLPTPLPSPFSSIPFYLHLQWIPPPPQWPHLQNGWMDDGFSQHRHPPPAGRAPTSLCRTSARCSWSYCSYVFTIFTKFDLFFYFMPCFCFICLVRPSFRTKAWSQILQMCSLTFKCTLLTCSTKLDLRLKDAEHSMHFMSFSFMWTVFVGWSSFVLSIAE